MVILGKKYGVFQSSVLLVAILLLNGQCSIPKQNSSREELGEVQPKKTKITSNQGKKIYDIYCLMCHGQDGQRILTGYYDLAKTELDVQGIIRVTRSGRNAMLPYQSILNEQELREVARYVEDLKK